MNNIVTNFIRSKIETGFGISGELSWFEHVENSIDMFVRMTPGKKVSVILEFLFELSMDAIEIAMVLGAMAAIAILLSLLIEMIIEAINSQNIKLKKVKIKNEGGNEK